MQKIPNYIIYKTKYTHILNGTPREPIHIRK